MLLKATAPTHTKPAQGVIRVVQANATVESEKTVPRPAVFMVVEGHQYGNALVWQVSVWRITVFERNPRVMNTHAAQQSLSKSI